MHFGRLALERRYPTPSDTRVTDASAHLAPARRRSAPKPVKSALAIIRAQVRLMLRSWPGRQIGPMDEDDLVQKVVEHLLRNEDAMSDLSEGSVQQRVAFLRFQTRFRVCDEERKWLRRRDLEAENPATTPDQTEATPESWATYSQTNDVILESLGARFGEEGVLIFRMAWTEGKSNPEIASRLGIADAQVATKKMRIRDLVREVLTMLDVAAPPRGSQGRRVPGGEPS